MRCVIVIGHMKIVSTKIATSIPLRKLLLKKTRSLSAEIDTTKIETTKGTNANETITVTSEIFSVRILLKNFYLQLCFQKIHHLNQTFLIEGHERNFAQQSPLDVVQQCPSFCCLEAVEVVE